LSRTTLSMTSAIPPTATYRHHASDGGPNWLTPMTADPLPAMARWSHGAM
jgi:hypothetical protein